jgi:hypothetical protein
MEIQDSASRLGYSPGEKTRGKALPSNAILQGATILRCFILLSMLANVREVLSVCVSSLLGDFRYRCNGCALWVILADFRNRPCSNILGTYRQQHLLWYLGNGNREKQAET